MPMQLTHRVAGHKLGSGSTNAKLPYEARAACAPRVLSEPRISHANVFAATKAIRYNTIRTAATADKAPGSRAFERYSLCEFGCDDRA